MNGKEYDKEKAFRSVLRSFDDLTKLENQISENYVNFQGSLEKERREMFKYVGTIAGATAALSPQIFINIDTIDHNYFFIGVLFLVIDLTISMLYVMSSVENERADVLKGLQEQIEKMQNIKDVITKFLLSPRDLDDFNEFNREFGGINSQLQKEKEEIDEKEKEKKQKFYQGMDYASEFLLFFFICGITFLILSITSVSIKNTMLFFYGTLIFTILIVMSIFQKKIFVWFGFPVDFLRAIFRWILKKITNKFHSRASK